jgi:WD40 repeat protein
MRSKIRLRRGLWTSFAAVLTLSHCAEGGLNLNEQMPGDGDNGVAVGFGEIAIDPSGSYLLSRSEDALVYGDLKTTEVRPLPAMGMTERVAFAHTQRELFATRNESEYEGRLFRYDLESDQEVWSRRIDVELSWDTSGFGTRPWLDVLEDDSRLVLTFERHVEIVDATSGAELFRTPGGQDIIDVDLTPDQRRLVVTRDHVWSDDGVRTTLEVYDLASYAKTTIEVPNCADELVIAPDGGHAFLAPTRCSQDPISVIDLSAQRFVRNLPGFGPVALAPNGGLAVGFLDRDNVDDALFDDKTQIPARDSDPYHLMLIDTATLKFELIPLGDTLPRYAMSPDGKLLLVDADSFFDDGQVRVLDVKTKTLAVVDGPDVRLDNYVMTSDSRRVFLLDQKLYRIDLEEHSAEAEPIEFTPDNLNITPDDRMLVLRQNSNTLWLYDVESGKLLRKLRLEGER